MLYDVIDNLYEVLPTPLILTRAVSFIGLFLIAIGTGGIKPCVAPFGAEQFKLPEQESQLGDYFSWFYAAINAGSMISALLTPNLRNTECLGQENCFPLAFGVPSAIMAAALGNFTASTNAKNFPKTGSKVLRVTYGKSNLFYLFSLL